MTSMKRWAAVGVMVAACGSGGGSGPEVDGARGDAAGRGDAAVGDGAPCLCDAPLSNVRVLGIAPETASVSVGRQVALVVTLEEAAGSGGQLVALASAEPGIAATESSVRVGAGETSASFLVTGVSASPGGLTTITATSGGASATSGVLVVSGEPAVARVDGVSELVSGGTGVATVTISRAADLGGQVVELSSTTASVIVPASVTVPAGATTATFGLRGGAGTGTAIVEAQTTSGIVASMVVTTTATARAPGANELVINEVLADVPGAVASDLVGDANCDGARGDADELIEIYNWSEVPFELAGVSLWDSTFASPGSAGVSTLRMTFPAFVLGPGEAIVVFPAGLGTTGTSLWCAGVTASRIGDSVAFTGGAFALDDDRDDVVLRATEAADSAVVSAFALVVGFGRDQSVTLAPDGGTDYSDYLVAPGHAVDRAFSPGTRVDGAPWASVRP